MESTSFFKSEIDLFEFAILENFCAHEILYDDFDIFENFESVKLGAEWLLLWFLKKT